MWKSVKKARLYEQLAIRKMKKLTKKIICSVIGHKWFIYYVYGPRAHAKCNRCDVTKDDFIEEFI